MGVVGGETHVGPKISYQMNAESLNGGADTSMLRTQNPKPETRSCQTVCPVAYNSSMHPSCIATVWLAPAY